MRPRVQFEAAGSSFPAAVAFKLFLYEISRLALDTPDEY